MNLQQLRIVRETARRQFNLTEVANALFTAQSGVSKHIKDLEDELGVDLFARRGKRLLGLTAPGQELMPIVERILLDLQNIKRLGLRRGHYLRDYALSFIRECAPELTADRIKEAVFPKAVVV